MESIVALPCAQRLGVRASDGIRVGRAAFSAFPHQTWQSSIRRATGMPQDWQRGLELRLPTEAPPEAEMGLAVQQQPRLWGAARWR